jgi:LuxR family transcriptional regulator, maltose regulon positive regulatory protein
MAAGEGWDAVGGVGAHRDGGQVVSRPALFARLGTSARVTVVSAPAGSGKTVLLRSWIGEAGLTGHAAWVPVGPDEQDPHRFWLSVVQAFRRTGPGSGLIQAVSAAPDLDGWALVERLLADLAALEDRLWLVIDDVHELGSAEALRQLELLVMRAPPTLRFVLTSRHDVRLGLHRLRLDGGLAEIRAADLRFSLAEAKELLASAGVAVAEPAVAMLHERTEGWAAGLRLAALSLAEHPDPGRFAAEFSGSERTVAEYLLAEVLERQSEQVRRLLLRTSVLERVNGELADLLTGHEGGEGVLQDLEQANAFVVSLDSARTWFRYHQLFADLLQVELRRSEPGEVAWLQGSAASWFAERGFPAEAIRHAQAARDWPLAARLLADYWPSLHLDGQGATVHAALAGFPSSLAAADAELAVVAAADELGQGSLAAAGHYLGLAERGSASVPEARRGQLELLLGVVRLLLDRQRGDLPAVVEEARQLSAMAEAIDPARPGLGQDLRALALISLGISQYWAGAPDAERSLEQGVALARRVGRPYLEFTGLANWAGVVTLRSFPRAAELGREAAELGQRHGWTDDPAFGLASTILGAVLAWQARPEETERWVQSAERTLRAEAEPTAGPALSAVRGALEMVRKRDAEAVSTFEAAILVARRLESPHFLIPFLRTLLVHALIRLGQTELAGQYLTELTDEERGRGETAIAEAALRLAQDDPGAATAVLAPVLDGSAPLLWPNGLAAEAYVLEAIARDALDDQAAAHNALERALDVAEPDGIVTSFLLYPAPRLLERHARQPTGHASLLAEIQSALEGAMPSAPIGPRPLLQALSESELRVLRYLPTNLTAPDIARELYVSSNTVKTHIRNVYAKLGTHRRAEVVARARTLGLLAPSGAARTKAATPAL